MGATLLATLGCASTPPAPDGGVDRERAPVPVVREAPRPPAATPVRASFAYAAGTVSYVVTSEATIAEIDSAGSAPRTFREVARLQVTVSPADGQAIVTTTGSVEGAIATASVRPFVDTLRVVSADSVAEPRMPICGRDTVPPMHLVILLPPVPAELREGLRWQRRHVYAICQGVIPVRLERTDNYVVTGSASQAPGSGVTLSRSSSLAYNGSGVEGQHNVRITGSGSAQASFILDALAGRLVRATEELNSEIDITSSGRTRRFSQRVTRRVALAR